MPGKYSCSLALAQLAAQSNDISSPRSELSLPPISKSQDSLSPTSLVIRPHNARPYHPASRRRIESRQSQEFARSLKTPSTSPPITPGKAPHADLVARPGVSQTKISHKPNASVTWTISAPSSVVSGVVQKPGSSACPWDLTSDSVSIEQRHGQTLAAPRTSLEKASRQLNGKHTTRLEARDELSLQEKLQRGRHRRTNRSPTHNPRDSTGSMSINEFLRGLPRIEEADGLVDVPAIPPRNPRRSRDQSMSSRSSSVDPPQSISSISQLIEGIMPFEKLAATPPLASTSERSSLDSVVSSGGFAATPPQTASIPISKYAAHSKVRPAEKISQDKNTKNDVDMDVFDPSVFNFDVPIQLFWQDELNTSPSTQYAATPEGEFRGLEVDEGVDAALPPDITRFRSSSDAIRSKPSFDRLFHRPSAFDLRNRSRADKQSIASPKRGAGQFLDRFRS